MLHSRVRILRWVPGECVLCVSEGWLYGMDGVLDLHRHCNFALCTHYKTRKRCAGWMNTRHEIKSGALLHVIVTVAFTV